MGKKQILALFVYSLTIWTVGNGLLPLLPVYAKKLGADSAVSGYYMSFSYFALAAGAIAAGWVSDRFNRHKAPLILVGVAGIPIAWLMGRVESIWSLSLLTAGLWALGGLGLALVGILTGLSAEKNERGKIYGIISLTNGLGTVIGCLATGYIADRWGYASLFSVVAVFFILSPLAGMFLKEVEPGQGKVGPTKKKLYLGKNYHLLFSASLVVSVAYFVIVLGRSLLMSDLKYGAFAISSAVAVGGLVAMPFPLLMGWLSDRSDRKIPMCLGYLACTTSLFVLAKSTSLWNFYIVSILQSLYFGVYATVGNAWVTEIVPRESLGRGLSLFSATSWIGGILGFAVAGYAFQNLGMLPSIVIAMGLPLIAVVFLIPIRLRTDISLPKIS